MVTKRDDMLRISKLADYAALIMAHLAKDSTKLCSARDLSKSTNLAMPTVSKLLKTLTAAGLLVSVRGVQGGYKLLRDPCDISLAEIIYALDSERGLTECSYDSYDCALKNVCHVKENWRTISRVIDSALSSVSLEDFSNPSMAMTYKFGVSGGRKK
jgi:FeS assembly SUF system regulator